MQEYDNRNRRKTRRGDANFVISYHLQREDANYDLTQTKNVSQGGMLLTTNRKFEKGTRLDMTMQFPFLDDKIQVVGEVVGSKEVLKDLIYETRLMFYDLKGQYSKKLDNFVKEHSK
jgi:hypothetical protein